MRGCFHVHSENSLGECPLFIDDIISKAKELEYDAVCLTDDINMTGAAEFIKKAKIAGIKPIPGVELRIKDEIGTTKIVLMAKDYLGYVGICKAVSQENKIFEDGEPVLDWNRLELVIGSTTPYYGHVYASGSDAYGILGRIAAQKVICRKKALQLRDEANHIAASREKKGRKSQDPEEIKKEIAEMEHEKKSIAHIKDRIFTVKEDEIRNEKDPLLRAEAERKLEAEKEETRKAMARYKNLAASILRKKKKLETLAGQKTIQDKNMIKRDSLLQEAENLLNEAKISDERLMQEITDQITRCKMVFGNLFFVELMFHGKEEEAEAVPYLVEAAKRTETETILSNDVHILEAGNDDILKWEIIRTLKDNKYRPIDETAASYRMKSEDELSGTIEGLADPDTIERSLETMSRICDEASFEWPKDKHYPRYDVQEGMTAHELLSYKARENIKKIFSPEEWTEQYEQRLMHELPIISKTGYSDYTLIIADIIKEGRDIRHDGEISDFIGPGRGSGAGSLVNYLMGITKIDPIKNDLYFERYLNIERISPPDIDSDIATSVRPLMVRYITEKYSRQKGKVGVCTITTKSRLTSKAAIKAAGRALSAKYYGSAAALYSVSDRISKAVPVENKKALPIRECAKTLCEQFNDKVSIEIIHYAYLIEGILSGYGTHAAGMIISDNGDVTDYAPVINMGTQENPVWNIQFDKEESEEIGLLKLDMLGLTTLDIITNTLKRIYRTKGIKVNLDHIPFEQEVFTEIYGKGDTVGVFQCESDGMRKMWQDLQPDRIDDIIAGVALYRPGPMDSIPQYIANKQHPDKIRYIVPQLKPILSSTYGIIVYQEQVMRIVRDLGGFSMGRSDLVRRAMAKKKQAIMDKERKNFVYGNKEEGIRGCVANGIPEEAANKIYDMMIDFAKYAFNKSHAAAYAVVSYQSAWLKYHYPKEYLIEAMQQQKTEDIPLFVNECRRKGFKLRCPDVNISVEGFTEKDGDILYGLGNVKGVGSQSDTIIRNRKDAYYKNLADFIERSGANKRATEALIKGGAFDQFGISRTEMLESLTSLISKIKRIKTLQVKTNQKRDRLSRADISVSMREKIKHQLSQDELSIKTIREEIVSILFASGNRDDPKRINEMEKDVLYTYISAHPLDRYQGSLSRFDPISSMDTGEKYRIGGMISDLRIVTTKAGQPMAVFMISDRTGEKKVICWPSIYEETKEKLKDDYIIKIYGTYRSDKEGNTFMEAISIQPLEDALPACILSVSGESEFQEIVNGDMKRTFSEKQGSEVIAYDRSTGHLIRTKCKVRYGFDSPKLNITYTRSVLPVEICK